MGRKKEEREAKADHKKARRLAKEAAENEVEDDSISLAHQLAPLGRRYSSMNNSVTPCLSFLTYMLLSDCNFEFILLLQVCK